MNKILVPFDFTAVANHALDFACRIARKTAGEVHLIHVIEHPTIDSFRTMGIQEPDPMEQLYIKRLIEAIKGKLERVVSDADHEDDKLSFNIRIGNSFHNIIDAIVEEKVDLLVMGTEGAEGLNEFFVGSNAEKVVRKASCPVITLREKADPALVKKIVFASGFMYADDAFIGRVKNLQQMFEAQLNIVKINTPASFTSTRHDKKQMEAFVKKYDIDNYTLDVYNYKNEEDGIVLYAQDTEADMIALGSHQRKGVGHFLIGSIAEDVVNHARVPVWTSHLDTKTPNEPPV